MSIYIQRRAALAAWMEQHSIAMVLLEDTEGNRDPSIRYFTGHPGDALLAVRRSGFCVLCPWDENIAVAMADADEIIPLGVFDRTPGAAAAGLARHLNILAGSRIEIPGTISYPRFLRFLDALSGYDVLCRVPGVLESIEKMRSIKDEKELHALRTACSITDSIINSIEKRLKEGEQMSEIDVALLIERESRCAGGEGTGFETLAAGAPRSFGIHCFPACTAGPFGERGLSILDFGVKWGGYTSDVTLTVARGPLLPAQEKQLALVERVYTAVLPLYQPGLPAAGPAVKADELFEKGKRRMPHALGHGIGLAAHEEPAVRSKDDSGSLFEPGMVVTLEPGLYDPKLGGCRLENDILITQTGREVLTNSRIIRF